MAADPPPTDLDNRTLTRIVAHSGGLMLVAVLAGANARQWYPDTFAPGSPFMQSIAIVGALCLVAAACGALSKRFGASARHGFRLHVWLASVGGVLVAFHSAGAFKAPSLMLLLIIMLALAGWWGRVRASVTLSRGFGRKPAMLGKVDRRAALRDLIAAKTLLLARLDPRADEALFSLQPGHWLRAPFVSYQFQRAVYRERELLGAHQIYEPADRLWRVAHQLLAWALVGGIVIHVVLATFFAGYVSDGAPVYWWHVTAWTIG